MKNLQESQQETQQGNPWEHASNQQGAQQEKHISRNFLQEMKHVKIIIARNYKFQTNSFKLKSILDN